jgi:NADH-quinone oxidoreductase subunit L
VSLAGEKGNAGFFLAALIGAFVTSVYTFRMVFVTFFGQEKTHVSHHAGNRMTIPLVVLAILSTFAGFIELPHNMAHVQWFSHFLTPVLPEAHLREGIESIEWIVQVVAIVLSLGGVYMAYYFFIKKPDLAEYVKSTSTTLHNFWYSGWAFDAIYNTLFVKPFVFLATINKKDIIDSFYNGLVSTAEFFHRMFAWTQSGILRWYMVGIVVGAILIVTLGLLVGS